MENVKHSYGRYLREARKRHGYSMQDVADACGVSRTAISRYEAGQLSPKREMRIKLSQMLNIPIEMMESVSHRADMTMPTVIELWQRIGPDDRIRALEFLSSLASKNLPERD